MIKLELLSDMKGLVVYGQTRSDRGKYRHFKNKMAIFNTAATSLIKTTMPFLSDNDSSNDMGRSDARARKYSIYIYSN